jgi:tetratricopeptide (TPR) repeat protein
VESGLDDRVKAALERGEPRQAIELLRDHLATQPDPEVRFRLGLLLFFVELPASREHFELALEEFLAAGKVRRAAVVAARLGIYYMSGVGNRVVARPWFARAWRLLEGEGDCIERAQVAIADVACNADDPAVLRERADIALAIARKLHDVTLEAKALADSGLALVELGEVADGLARLDEAIALITSGEIRDRVLAAQSCCAFLSACYYAGDFGRVEAWSPVLRERRLIGEGGFPILSGHCDSVYGHLLCNLGRWSEAEAVLERAIETTQNVGFSGRLHAGTALADLRIRQGRLDEAEALLIGRDDHMEALIPMARLHLARGDHELAVATARRGVRMIKTDRVRAVTLLAVQFAAELARGDLDAAAAVSAELDARALPPKLPALDAEAAFARACLAAARGDVGGAVRVLDDALVQLDGVDLPLIKAKLHAELARLHAPTDRAAARVDARAALAIHARIDAALPDDEARALQELAGGGVAPRVASAAVLARADGGWVVTRERASFKLRDAKGMHYLAELLANPGVDRHVFDLVALTDPVDDDRRALGDAGPMLDAAAKAAYRRRIEGLRERIEDAEARGDQAGALRMQDELDAIARELARSVGLGGRDRRVASSAEKARLNVTRALRTAIEKIGEGDAAAAAALDAAIRTGLYCSYRVGDDDVKIAWKVDG